MGGPAGPRGKQTNKTGAFGSRRFDFVAAYLQGELEDGETVYCLPPPGYENKRIGYSLRRNRAPP